MWTRRAALAGAVAISAMGAAPVRAADDLALFRTGRLSRNRAAAQFQRVAVNARWPAVTLIGPEGPRSPADLVGKAHVLQLWAEWCPPCLVEAADLAGLHRRAAGPGFDILSILTASRAGLDLAGARARLARADAAGLPVWIEPTGGKVLFQAFAARTGVGDALPCTLLIDRYGRIRGRSFASPPADPVAFAEVLSRYKRGADGRYRGAAASGLMHNLPTTVWSTSEGDELAAALADGVLDRIAG